MCLNSHHKREVVSLVVMQSINPKPRFDMFYKDEWWIKGWSVTLHLFDLDHIICVIALFPTFWHEILNQKGIGSSDRSINLWKYNTAVNGCMNISE